MTRPWMPLYVGDYLGDTRRLKTVEHGAYLLLIMEYWQHGALPDSDEELADIAGLDLADWVEMRPKIARLFKPGWKHKRIDQELAKAEEVSSKRRENALLRWSKSNANAEQKQSKCDANGMHRARVPQPQSQNNLEATPLVEAGASTGEAVVVSISRKSDPERKVAIRAFGEWWNGLASSLGFPQIDRIEGSREVAVLQRTRRLREDHGSVEEGLRFLEAKIRGSPFLQGKTGWRGFSFDWCLKAGNFQKIVEGNYEREIQQARR